MKQQTVNYVRVSTAKDDKRKTKTAKQKVCGYARVSTASNKRKGGSKKKGVSLL